MYYNTANVQKPNLINRPKKLGRITLGGGGNFTTFAKSYSCICNLNVR